MADSTAEVVPEPSNGEKERAPQESCYLFLVQPSGRTIGTGCIMSVLARLRELGITSDTPAAQIDLVLHSNGGDPDTAYRMLRVIRACCERLHILVPDHAKSAATLMALGADAIHMGFASELGPLDMQLEHPTQERWSSALDGTRCVLDIQSAVVQMAKQLVRYHSRWFRRYSGLKSKDIVEQLCRMASDSVAPITAQIDPWVFHECFRLLEAMEHYGRVLLSDYMFAGKADKEEAAGRTAQALVRNYPIHSFVILRDEADKELGLTIKKGEKRPDWADLEKICRMAWRYRVCICTAKRPPLDVANVLDDGVRYDDEDPD